MKLNNYARSVGCVAVAALICNGANAQTSLYDNTQFDPTTDAIKTSAGTVVGSKGFLLVDDISVPAGGWCLAKLSTYWAPFVSDSVAYQEPTAGPHAKLYLFPKNGSDLPTIDPNNPANYITVSVTSTQQDMTDPLDPTFVRHVTRIDTARLNLAVAQGDYWIGIEPEVVPDAGAIDPATQDHSSELLAWGSYIQTDLVPMWYTKTPDGSAFVWQQLNVFTFHDTDLLMKIQGAVGSCCIANFNGVGGVTVADIFAFLNAWFAGLPSANVNGVGGVTVADIFFFLNHWFAGC